MQLWGSLKEALAGWAGIDPDALRIVASLLLALAAALLLRRPLSSPLPWLLVLLIAAANEAASGLADGRFLRPELAQGLRDLLVVMALPTALLLLGRFAPQLLAPREDRRIYVGAVREAEPGPEGSIVEAQYRRKTG